MKDAKISRVSSAGPTPPIGNWTRHTYNRELHASPATFDSAAQAVCSPQSGIGQHLSNLTIAPAFCFLSPKLEKVQDAGYTNIAMEDPGMSVREERTMRCLRRSSMLRVSLALLGSFLVCLVPAIWAQTEPAAEAVRMSLTIKQGVPLRIKLLRRVPINHPNVPVEGRLAAPVYVYNREVLPAGTQVLGRVTQVTPISRWRRAHALMEGDFTPWRTARVSFDTIVLKDGQRLPISTRTTPGIQQVVRLESGPAKKRKKDPIFKAKEEAKQEIRAKKQQALAMLKGPGKLHRIEEQLKAVVVARLPYHRQFFPAGTVFSSVLQEPLRLGTEVIPAQELARVGSPPPPNSVVHARLVTALNSATARQGMPVRAVVTRPLFASGQRLIIPQGSRLEGTVVRAKRARWLHRNGGLRFTFQRIEPPRSKAQAIQASLQELEAPKKSHLKVTPEGTVMPAESKARYLLPALAISVAAWTATPDRDAVNAQSGAAVPGQGGALGQTIAGGWGLGLLGSAISLAANSRFVSAALGFYGAAGSVYSSFIARGRNVVFTTNTPIEIRLGTHEGSGEKLKLPPPPPSARRG